MRGLAATFAVTALVGLCSISAEAAPARVDKSARIAKLSAAEQKWVTPLITLWNQMNAGLHLVGPEAAAKNALVAGSGKNNTLLSRTLIAFAACPSFVKHAGKPPSNRLVAFTTALKGSCTHLSTGAHDVAKAIGAFGKNNKLVNSLLIQATSQFKQGSTLLGTAQKQLLAVGGKNIFAA